MTSDRTILLVQRKPDHSEQYGEPEYVVLDVDHLLMEQMLERLNDFDSLKRKDNQLTHLAYGETCCPLYVINDQEKFIEEHIDPVAWNERVDSGREWMVCRQPVSESLIERGLWAEARVSEEGICWSFGFDWEDGPSFETEVLNKDVMAELQSASSTKS